MEVIISTEFQTKTFQELRNGDMFIEHNDDIVYMKLLNYEQFNCVRLRDGFLHNIRDNQKIIPLVGEFVLKPIL